MRKSLLKLALGGMAVLSMSAVTNAETTLTQDWKHTEGVTAVAEARWGVGQNGKIYTNDKSGPKILCWDENGKTELLADGGAGTAITIDDAGNIIVSNGWAGAGAATNYQILPAGATELQKLEITMPGNAVAGRMDYIGRAVGNVMSAEGGAFYIAAAASPDIAKIFVAEGKQVADKSKSFVATVACSSDGHAQPIGTDPNKDEFVAKSNRTNGTFAIWKDGAFTALAKGDGQSSTAGGDAVILDGKLYTVNPSATAYADGFIVCDETGAIIASHAEEVAAASPYGNALNFEKVDEYTANIYQYVPGRMVAKYTLAFDKPVPPVALDAMNAYAYDINVVTEGETATVTYRLNAPATAVKVQIWNGTTMVREVEGTAKAQTVAGVLDNQNTATISTADLPGGTNVFKVAVESAALTAPTKYAKQYSFYHPATVAMDKNIDSPYFGRLYVTEAMPSPAGYHSTGEGQGIYVFDPMLEPVKNAAGTYAFKGGQTFPSVFSNGKSSYDPRKIRISKDGRVFVSGQNPNGIALWEINPADLEAEWTPVIKGTPNADNYEITATSGDWMAAPNVSMDLKGEGENLTILMLSTNKNGIDFAYRGYRTDEYNLGTATTWDAAPSRGIDQLSGQFTITHSATTLAYDNEGGIWYANSRASATEAEPTLVHVNAQGVIDYKVADSGNTFFGGGGIAFNNDYTLLAIGLNRIDASTGCIGVYEVSKDTEGKPVLTEKYKINAAGLGRNVNDIAWDYADNLYVVGNSGEKFQAYALPRTEGTATVAAPTRFNIENEVVLKYPAQLHIVGNVSDLAWDAAKSVVMTAVSDGVYTAQIKSTEEGQNFVVCENIGDWDAINAARYGFETDNANVVLNTEMPIIKVADGGAMRLPYAGEWDVTVDLTKMTVNVQGDVPAPVYPEALYVIGTVDEVTHWNPAAGIEMTKDSEAVFTIDDLKLYPAGDDGYAYFAFTSVKTDDWNVVNANRFGPSVKDTELTSGTVGEIGKNGDTAFKALAKTYDVTIDLEAGTIKLTETGGGVAEVKDAVAVIGGNGEIRILGAANTTSIYTIAGQAVALNSTQKTFNVAAGAYVVVVNGKSVKVLVK